MASSAGLDLIRSAGCTRFKKREPGRLKEAEMKRGQIVRIFYFYRYRPFAVKIIPFNLHAVFSGHDRTIIFTVCCVVAFAFHAEAQKQLVFLLRGAAVARYSEGDQFKCVLKNRQHKEGFIVELQDFSMITSNDTIPFQSIAKIKAGSPSKIKKRIGGLLLLTGLGYVAIDQLNTAFGYNPPGFDQSDWNGLIVGSAGVAILLIKTRYQRLKRGTIMRTVDNKSPYYLQK